MSARLKFGLLAAAEGDLTSLPPLGAACVAAAVRRAVPGAEPLLFERLEDLLAARPALAGLSATTDNYALAVRWAKRIKAELGAPVILGGAHISLAPWSLDPVFDAAVVGEGELAAPELVSAYLGRGAFEPGDLRRIPGLAFAEAGRVVVTPPRPQAEDLAALPRPYDELAPWYRGRDARHVFSARGCPFRCDFCSSSRLFSGYRALPAAALADDLERLVAREGARRIIFYDDLFIAGKERLAALAGELERRGLAGRCAFTVSARADLLDGETCGLLARLGADLAALGLESFSDPVLRDLGKKGLTAGTNQRALGLLGAAGIGALGLLMFGAPAETAEDAAATLAAVEENALSGRLRDAYCGLLSPYPGTVTWERAARRGLVSADMDWGRFSGGASRLYLGERLPLPELKRLIAAWRAKPAAPGLNSLSRTSLFYRGADAVL